MHFYYITERSGRNRKVTGRQCDVSISKTLDPILVLIIHRKSPNQTEMLLAGSL